MKCKTFLQIGTFNANTYINQGKHLELANNLNKYKLNILGIVNHKIVHKDDPTEIEVLENCTLLTSLVLRGTPTKQLLEELVY